MTRITLEPRPGADPEDGRETETLTGEATRRIRQSILDGELEPNARLNEVQFAASACRYRARRCARRCRHWLARDW